MKYSGQVFRLMRLLQISDVHGSLEAVSRAVARSHGCDAVMVVGDITHFGGVPQAEPLLQKLADSGLKVYFVAGNCDHPALLTWEPSNPNIVNLHLRTEKFEGMELVGLGGGNLSPFNTLIEFNEDEFSSMLSGLKLSTERFILVSHTPPYGADADVARGRHLGSTAVRKFVEEKKPVAVCCGHIHEARSVSFIGRTVVVNAGPARDGFCAYLNISGPEVSAELQRL
ncbi:MAG: metallophosphoesterase [Candidatus Caldarchaeum sp.]